MTEEVGPYDAEILELTYKVDQFIQECARIYPDRSCQSHLLMAPQFGQYAYSKALHVWKRGGCDPEAYFYFQTNFQPCLWLLEFRQEIYDRFGLKIKMAHEVWENLKCTRLPKFNPSSNYTGPANTRPYQDPNPSDQVDRTTEFCHLMEKLMGTR